MKLHLTVLLSGVMLCLIGSAQPDGGESSTFNRLELIIDKLDTVTASHVSGLSVYGRFVAATELESDPLFRTFAPIRNDDPKRQEIYLLTLSRTDNQPGRKRLMEIEAAVHLPNNRVVEFSLVPRSILMRGQCWNLVQVVDHDHLLPAEVRTDILRLKPTVEIRKVIFK